MALKNTFRELVIQKAEKQTELVDSLLEDAPILGMIPSQPTSSGLTHQFERLLDVTGPGVVDLDGELPSIGSNTELGKQDMSLLGGIIEVGEDKLRALGLDAAAYFARNIAPAIKQSGMHTEQAVIYNYLRAFAIATYNDQTVSDYAQHLISAGGSANTNYSIVAVKWEPNQLYGLFNPEGLGNGLLFDMEMINGGNLYPLKADSKVLGRGMRVKADFGVLTANPRNVASVVNVDLSDADPANWKLPTQYQMDDILDAVRANTDGNTMLLMHPKVKSALSKFKSEKIEIRLAESNMTLMFDAWDGIPIIPSRNFKRGTEANVTVA